MKEELLNEITDEGAARLTEFYEENLHASHGPITDYEAHFNLGLIAWRAGDLDQCVTHLRAAAHQVIIIMERRDGQNLNELRVPHSVALPFLVVINFGSEEDRRRLARVQRNTIIQQEDNRYTSLADLLDVLRYYVDGFALSQEKLRSLLNSNQNPETDEFYKPWVDAIAQGLLAVAEKNALAAEKSMGYLLQLHEQLAREGGWQKLAEGLLSFWAMSLQTVAKKEGVTLRTKSPYLPSDM